MNETLTDGGAQSQQKAEPALTLKLSSHGTRRARTSSSRENSTRNFFGFEVVRPAKISLWCRLGGHNLRRRPGSREKTRRNEFPQPQWHRRGDRGRRGPMSPHRGAGTPRNGSLHRSANPPCTCTYSFYFWDADDNAWRSSRIRRAAIRGCSNARSGSGDRPHEPQVDHRNRRSASRKNRLHAIHSYRLGSYAGAQRRTAARES